MNKILAAAIAATTFGTQAVAVELYNNDGTTFSIGGHVSVNLNGSEQGDTDVGTNSPRINFTATQDLGNGFTADARGEWALNYLDGGENSFKTRLGYLGLTRYIRSCSGWYAMGTILRRSWRSRYANCICERLYL